MNAHESSHSLLQGRVNRMTVDRYGVSFCGNENKLSKTDHGNDCMAL